MHIKKILLILLLLYYSISLAQAGTTLSPDGGHSNQKQITEALKTGDVYLGAGVYEVDGNITMLSNRVLSGDPNAIIRVWSGSSQWFTGSTGVITGSGVSNIEISGFQIDGNIGNLPNKYHQSRSDTAHDCEKLIQIYGSSNNFVENIEINKMKFYNSFSDAVYVRFADGVSCHDNVISNCQHEGIYYSVVKNGIMNNNKIAGITSDAARLDNCQDCLIENNLFYSYEGDSYGFYKNGHSGLQIGDAGSSNGYNGVKSKWHTSNIEVRFNTFADPGLRAIWLDAAGQKPSDNVFIHDNEFLDVAPVEIDGEPVSWDNQPSIEDSEEVFDSIFDVLNMEFSDGAYIEQGTLIPDKEWTKQGRYTEAWIDVTGYKGQLRIGNETYIPESPENCAIVLFGTENLAKRPVSQKTSTELLSKDGALTVKLTVKTKYKVKAYKTYKVLGQTVKVPYYKEKSETVEFEKTFDAPEVFPVFEPPTVYVTHYNGSHAIVYTPEIDGIVRVDTSYNDSECTERRLLGYIGTAENGFKSTRYENIDSWSISGKQITQSRKGVYIKEPFDIEKLNVTVVTPYDSFKIEEFEYEVIEDDSLRILSYPLLSFLAIIGIYGRAILKVLYMVVGKVI